uniref:Uncharacterized protein n=1 Tax=Aquisalinus luteolus TaxID=1566827 RepID=A0A8J3A1S3_9PROT|nr:hypothetical protein GCM10011355_02060 [Aquisalinus luteolus]
MERDVVRRSVASFAIGKKHEECAVQNIREQRAAGDPRSRMMHAPPDKTEHETESAGRRDQHPDPEIA